MTTEVISVPGRVMDDGFSEQPAIKMAQMKKTAMDDALNRRFADILKVKPFKTSFYLIELIFNNVEVIKEINNSG